MVTRMVTTVQSHQQEEHELSRTICTQDLGPFQDRPKLLWVMQAEKAIVCQGLLCHPWEEGPTCQAPRVPEHEDIYSPAFVTRRETQERSYGCAKSQGQPAARSHWHPQMSLMEGPGMGVGRPSQGGTLGVSSGEDCPKIASSFIPQGQQLPSIQGMLELGGCHSAGSLRACGQDRYRIPRAASSARATMERRPSDSKVKPRSLGALNPLEISRALLPSLIAINFLGCQVLVALFLPGD